MKKSFLSVIMAVMLASSITACTETNTPNNNNEAATAQTSEKSGNTAANICNQALAAFDNNEIYFLNDTANYAIYKMNPDGSNITAVTDINCGYINVLGDWVYYNNCEDESYNIWRVKKDGSSAEKLNEHWSECINVVGDYIYYTNKSKLTYLRLLQLGNSMTDQFITTPI